jgi:hexosaminidase
MQNEKRLDYMLFPRMAGLAEAAWRNNNTPKDYGLFRQRLQGHLGLYANAGLYYFDPSAPTSKLEPMGPKK